MIPNLVGKFRNRSTQKRSAYLSEKLVTPSKKNERAISNLFYAIEKAWSYNDQRTLKKLMTPAYFKKQKRILDRFTAKKQQNLVEDVVLLDIKEKSGSKKQIFVITAQAFDFLVPLSSSETEKQAIKAETYLTRFTEAWQVEKIGGKLCVKKIIQ